eukprot:SAG31_NODE_21_length_34109_cov_60.598824_2_plen_731_part_00
MFHSMATSWKNVNTNNQDFKELSPEFFYMPEFLLNLNRLDLGRTQAGESLGDVVLPPWANGSAEEFVRINRAALESEHVSGELHNWIDLIFGYKQRGAAAEAADNVFYYLTYVSYFELNSQHASAYRCTIIMFAINPVVQEGAVDLEAFDDPRMRQATEEQILEYGQTPAQLIPKKPHPKRDVETKSWQKGDVMGETLWACFATSSAGNSDAVVSVWAVKDVIVTLTSERELAVHYWMPFPNFQGAPFTFELDRNIGSRRLIGTHFARDVHVTPDCFALSKNGDLLLSCGHWDTTFKLSLTDTGQVCRFIPRKTCQNDVFAVSQLIINHFLLQEIESVGLGHKDIVTCLTLGQDGRTVVTGSRDATCMVWELDIIAIEKQASQSGSLFSGTSTSVGGTPARRKSMASPRCVLYGHRDSIHCVAVNTDIAVVASTAACQISSYGGCLLHNALTGVYIRSISHPKLARLRELEAAVMLQQTTAASSQTESAIVSDVSSQANVSPEMESRNQREVCVAGDDTEPNEFVTLGVENVQKQLVELRQELQGQRNAAATMPLLFGKVVITVHGQLVIHSPFDVSLYLFGLNGRQLVMQPDAVSEQMRSSADLPVPYMRLAAPSRAPMERVNAWTVTRDGECLVLAADRSGNGSAGTVKIRWIRRNLQLLHSFPLPASCITAPITSLALTEDETVVLIGLDDGRMSMIGCDCDYYLSKAEKRARDACSREKGLEQQMD